MVIEYFIISLIMIIVLLILAIVYDYNLKKLKQFAELEEKKYNKLIEKYPSNIDICRHILKKLNNKDVKIEEDKNQKTCLYIAITNKIIIANIKESYTRVQTICHECLHSIQSKKILLLNFIYSNLYLLYFFITAILGILGKVPNKNVFFSLMILFSYVFYFIRSYLENDAMIKAEFLAKEYMEEIKILTKDEINEIVKSYRRLNNLGIKMTNYKLFLETIVKTILICIIFVFR